MMILWWSGQYWDIGDLFCLARRGSEPCASLCTLIMLLVRVWVSGSNELERRMIDMSCWLAAWYTE